MRNNNIIKEVCAKLNISQKELAKLLNISYPTITRWSSKSSTIPNMWKITLNLILENIELKDKLNIIKQSQQIVNELE